MTAEGTSEIKEAIHTHLKAKGLNSHLQEVFARRHNSKEGGDLTRNQILDILLEEGIIDDVLSSLTIGAGKIQSRKDQPSVLKNETKSLEIDQASKKQKDIYLYIHCAEGRAFVDNILEPEPLQGKPASTLELHVQFIGKRFHTKPVPAICEPVFSETFKFLLQKHRDCGTETIKSVNLLSINDYIHFILLRTDCNGESTLVSSHFFDWRSVLAASDSELAFRLELYGIGDFNAKVGTNSDLWGGVIGPFGISSCNGNWATSLTGIEHNIPVGILDVQLRLSPSLVTPLKDGLISAQVSAEKSQAAEKDRLFLAYSKLWWQEYLEIRPEHRQRLVKIFAQDENITVKPVFSWVQQLHAFPFLETPREAAWFVSLLQQSKNIPAVGSSSMPVEQWFNPSTFLVLKKGDTEDHALLLCSFLLGFGLQAFVCLGTLKKGGPYAWVMTYGRSGQITFWDPLTSIRYSHQGIVEHGHSSSHHIVHHPFKTVGCIFNNKSFFANCQPMDDVDCCSFDIRNTAKWKAMSQDVLDMPSKTCTVLLPSSMNCISASEDLQQQICYLLTEHRSTSGLTTQWDSILCHLLTTALATYELQGKSGYSGGDEDFLTAVDNLVPDGHTFKALPLHFLYKHPRKSFYEILKSPLGKDIIECHGDQVRFGVQAKIYEYVEGVVSVWIMVAVRYKPIL